MLNDNKYKLIYTVYFKVCVHVFKNFHTIKSNVKFETANTGLEMFKSCNMQI